MEDIQAQHCKTYLAFLSKRVEGKHIEKVSLWRKNFLSERWEWSAKKSTLQRPQSLEKKTRQSAVIKVRDMAEEVMSCWKFFVKVKRTRQAIRPLCSAAKIKECLRNQKFCLTLQERWCRKGLQVDGQKCLEIETIPIRGQGKTHKVYSDQKVPRDTSSSKSNSIDVQLTCLTEGWMGPSQLHRINNFT